MLLDTALKDGSLGKTIDLSYASSSLIARQIEARIPCDAAILADDEWVQHLHKRKAIKTSVQAIATNSLVVVGPPGPRLSLIELLPGKTLILGEPKTVPLGRYSAQALQKLGILDQVKPLYASSARHAIMMAQSSLEHFAMVYKTDALASKLSIVQEVPAHLHDKIIYHLVICQNARGTNDIFWREALRSTAVVDALRQMGFGVASAL